MEALVVDDDSIAHRVFRRLLRPDTVDGARTIDEALALIGVSAYSLILVRWHGPARFDGLELLQRLRRISDWTLVALYNEEMPADVEVARAFELGADELILRPLERPAECVARIRALSRRQVPHHRARVASFGILEVDFAHQRVSVEKIPINLTRGEFRFLAYLARRRGAAVPKTELYGTVFESQYRGRNSNALPAAVSRLRRKLGRAGACIVAISGVGYTLEPIEHSSNREDDVLVHETPTRRSSAPSLVAQPGRRREALASR